MIPLPKPITHLIEQVNQLGFEIYLIGGAVRNFLLDKDVVDYDLTTNCPLVYIRHLYPLAPKDDCGKAFGNLKLNLDDLWVSITRYRQDVYEDNHRYPTQIIFVESLKEDLYRRDFTMNAIAYHPDEGIIDPLGGLVDIENRTIKTIIEPNLSLQQDALRILRALRFCSVLNFHLDQDLYQAILNQRSLIRFINTKSKTQELENIPLDYLEEYYPMLHHWLVDEVIQ